MSGTLYVIGTPIGNMKDVSVRAVERLRGRREGARRRLLRKGRVGCKHRSY